MAQKQICKKESEIENPNKATAVIKTLVTVTSLTLNLLVSPSDKRLDIIVPMDIIIDTIPAKDRGTLS